MDSGQKYNQEKLLEEVDSILDDINKTTEEDGFNPPSSAPFIKKNDPSNILDFLEGGVSA